MQRPHIAVFFCSIHSLKHKYWSFLVKKLTKEAANPLSQKYLHSFYKWCLLPNPFLFRKNIYISKVFIKG